MDNIQLIILGLTFLGVIAAIVGIPWYLSGRLSRIEQRLDLMAKNINGILGLIGHMLQISHKRAFLSDSELGELMAVYAEMARIPTHASPLTLEEQERINSYLNKVHHGQLFTSEEVEDYNNLVKKIDQEKKDDPGVWPLVALGAFLLGLFLVSKNKTAS